MHLCGVLEDKECGSVLDMSLRLMLHMFTGLVCLFFFFSFIILFGGFGFLSAVVVASFLFDCSQSACLMHVLLVLANREC